MKILRTDRELQTPRLDQTLRDDGHDLVLLPEGISERDLIAEVKDADLMLMCYTPITRAVIAAAPRLAGIVKYGVGIDAIDIAAAIERRIPVANIPEYAENTVAEGAFALMLALAKKLMPLNRKMRQDGWAWPESAWLGSDIAGKTVGVIGLGRIGRSFARMAGQGFLAKVVAYNPRVPASEMAALGVEKADDLRSMLAQSDVVSVHCVLNDETRHMLGREEFAAMKPGALFINVSRGAIADEAALRDAVQSGHLGGVALDTYSIEPLTRETHPLSGLFDRDNVILSPHLTFYTREAMQRLEDETLARCREIIEGRALTVMSNDPRLRSQRAGVHFV